MKLPWESIGRAARMNGDDNPRNVTSIRPNRSMNFRFKIKSRPIQMIYASSAIVSRRAM